MDYYLSDEDFAIAEANGIRKEVAYNRFYTLGWSREKAITEPVKEYGVRSLLWKKWKDKAVVKESAFRKRLKEGWTEEQAAMTLPRKPTGRPPSSNVKVSKEHVALAAKNGIKESTLRHRVYTYKWPIEEATTAPLFAKKRHIRYGKKKIV